MYKQIDMKEVLDSCAKTLAESRNIAHRRYALLVLWFHANSLCRDDSDRDDTMALIIKALKDDPNVEIRRHAAWAIGQLEDKKAIDPLILALTDEDWRVRFEAVKALDITNEGGMSSEGIPGMFQALGDNNMIVRMQALGQLLCVVGIHDEVNKRLVSEGAEPCFL